MLGVLTAPEDLMRQLLVPLSLVVACFTSTAWAATAQQNKMTTCQKSAGEKQLEGKERQAFVNECLKAKAPEAAPAAPPTQGQKLGACSKEAAAKGLKGDERNKYLSECSKR
jgi:hypothetical protein